MPRNIERRKMEEENKKIEILRLLSNLLEAETITEESKPVQLYMEKKINGRVITVTYNQEKENTPPLQPTSSTEKVPSHSSSAEDDFIIAEDLSSGEDTKIETTEKKRTPKKPKIKYATRLMLVFLGSILIYNTPWIIGKIIYSKQENTTQKKVEENKTKETEPLQK